MERPGPALRCPALDAYVGGSFAPLALALLLVALIAAPGCGGGPSERPDPETPGEPTPSGGPGAAEIDLPPGFPDGPEHRLDATSAPTPYTAAEIRLACPEGRVNKWQMTSAQGDFVSVQNFVSANENGARIQSLVLRSDGTPTGDTLTTTATWQELQSHASYTAESTEITSERTQVPAGSYDCWVYRVDEDETLTTYWFAKDLPGPPVKVTIHRGVERRLLMEMIEVVLGPPVR